MHLHDRPYLISVTNMHRELDDKRKMIYFCSMNALLISFNSYGIVSTILILLIIVYIVWVYNRLVRNRNKMSEAWSIIDVFLKQRYELVPTLVEVVKQYSVYENQVLEELTRLRTEAMEANEIRTQIGQESQLGNALDQLVITAENYPQLKANGNYLALQQQLAEIENDLEKSRRYYNGCVRETNVYIECFPSNIIARGLGFKKGVFFGARDSA